MGMGNLYQLWSKYYIPVGGHFNIDGPHDKDGVVVKFIRKGKGETITDYKGEYLYLVRGVS